MKAFLGVLSCIAALQFVLAGKVPLPDLTKSLPDPIPVGDLLKQPLIDPVPTSEKLLQKPLVDPIPSMDDLSRPLPDPIPSIFDLQRRILPDPVPEEFQAIPDPRCQNVEQFKVFPHFRDSTKYYECENGLRYTRRCPQGFRFNQIFLRCEIPRDSFGVHSIFDEFGRRIRREVDLQKPLVDPIPSIDDLSRPLPDPIPTSEEPIKSYRDNFGVRSILDLFGHYWDHLSEGKNLDEPLVDPTPSSEELVPESEPSFKPKGD